jgi:hypothetical protein
VAEAQSSLLLNARATSAIDHTVRPTSGSAKEASAWRAPPRPSLKLQGKLLTGSRIGSLSPKTAKGFP